MGLYKTHVKDMYVPYIVPSENGARTDVKWTTFLNEESAIGIRVDYVPFNFKPEMDLPSNDINGFTLNASMHSVAELEKAKHTCDLNNFETSEAIHVHIDHKMQGVAGDNTCEANIASR